MRHCKTCNVIFYSVALGVHERYKHDIEYIGGLILGMDAYEWNSKMKIYMKNASLYLNEKNANELVEIQHLLTYLRR